MIYKTHTEEPRGKPQQLRLRLHKEEKNVPNYMLQPSRASA